MKNPRTAASLSVRGRFARWRDLNPCFDLLRDTQPIQASFPRRTVPTQVLPFQEASVVSSDLTTCAPLSNPVALPSGGVPREGSIHE
jgi:hypothetical protein